MTSTIEEQTLSAPTVQAIRDRHPRFWAAIAADARISASHRGERFEFSGPLDTALQALRLAFVTDAFLAQCCYRAKARLQARGVPVIPRLLHRCAMVLGQIAIGDPVVVQPGVYIPHGQVVVDGITNIGKGVVLFPFVNVGLREGDFRGPTIRARAVIGTGAKVIGPVAVGAGAKIGANAVVVTDVPAGSTAIGVPARVRGS